MPLVTEDMIRAIAPKAINISELVKHLNIYLEQYEINTPLRVWHFLAQAAHEYWVLLNIVRRIIFL